MSPYVHQPLHPRGAQHAGTSMMQTSGHIGLEPAASPFLGQLVHYVGMGDKPSEQCLKVAREQLLEASVRVASASLVLLAVGIVVNFPPSTGHFSSHS